jgi:5-methylcytosine-specific restriction endonuclease McrA
MKHCNFIHCNEPIHAFNLCHTHYVRTWRKLKGYGKERFSGLRKQVLERDEYKCVMCGMTNEEHKQKWNREITLDHIDKVGRYAEYPNNTLNNLQTLCLRCHSHKDAIIHGRYAKNIERLV